jgi:hypothetical protein
LFRFSPTNTALRNPKPASPRKDRGRRKIALFFGYGDTVASPVAEEEIMNPMFVVTEGTTTDDVAAAGFPDPLYCKRGLIDHARLLADRIDAERGGDTDCGGAGMGYVPDVAEVGE